MSQDDTPLATQQSFFERYRYDQWMPAPPRLVADCPRGLLHFPEHTSLPPNSPHLYFTPPESPELEVMEPEVVEPEVPEVVEPQPPQSPPTAPQQPEPPEPSPVAASTPPESCAMPAASYASPPMVMRLDDLHRCGRFLNGEWTFAMCFYRRDTMVKLWRLQPKFTRMLLRSCKDIPTSRLACREDFAWIGWPSGVIMYDVEVLLWSPQTFAAVSMEAYAQRTPACKTFALPADADWFPLIQRMRQLRMDKMSKPRF